MPTLSAGKGQVLKVLVPTPSTTTSPPASVLRPLPLYQSSDRALEQRGREEKEHTFIINIINTRWAGFPQDIFFFLSREFVTGFGVTSSLGPSASALP